MNPYLFRLFNSIYPVSERLQNRLNEILHYREIKKKEYLLKEGQVSEHIYFIEKGLLRSFYSKGKNEVTAWFMKENDVIVSVKSFFTQQPGYENIQAIEDSCLHYIHYNDLQKLYEDFVEFNIIGRLITIKYYIASEDRLFSIRKQKATKRYNYLLETQPEIIQRAPRSYIATYLGISLETLSRLSHKK